MNHRYVFEFSVDLAEMVPGVRDITDGVNSQLSRLGLTERLVVRADALNVSLESSRPLTFQEERTVRDFLEKQLREKLPSYDFRCQNVRRQSGNVQQSVE